MSERDVEAMGSELDAANRDADRAYGDLEMAGRIHERLEEENDSLRTALSAAVEALEGCWARLKTDRELVQKHAGLGKVYDGLVEDAESALAAARAVSGEKA